MFLTAQLQSTSHATSFVFIPAVQTIMQNYQEELRGFAKCVLWNYLSTPYKHIADAQFQLGTEPFPNF